MTRTPRRSAKMHPHNACHGHHHSNSNYAQRRRVAHSTIREQLNKIRLNTIKVSIGGYLRSCIAPVPPLSHTPSGYTGRRNSRYCGLNNMCLSEGGIHSDPPQSSTFRTWQTLSTTPVLLFSAPLRPLAAHYAQRPHSGATVLDDNYGRNDAENISNYSPPQKTSFERYLSRNAASFALTTPSSLFGGYLPVARPVKHILKMKLFAHPGVVASSLYV